MVLVSAVKNITLAKRQVQHTQKQGASHLQGAPLLQDWHTLAHPVGLVNMAAISKATSVNRQPTTSQNCRKRCMRLPEQATGNSDCQ